MFSTAAAIFSLLLVVTGVAKLVRPRDVEKAIKALGMPVMPLMGFLIGGLEVGVGGMALFYQQALIAQAVMYTVFAGWVGLALVRGVPIASCGCLGRDDTPPTTTHVALNLLAAGVSALASVDQGLVFNGGLEWVATAAVIATGTFLAYVVLADGARLEGVRAK